MRLVTHTHERNTGWTEFDARCGERGIDDWLLGDCVRVCFIQCSELLSIRLREERPSARNPTRRKDWRKTHEKTPNQNFRTDSSLPFSIRKIYHLVTGTEKAHDDLILLSGRRALVDGPKCRTFDDAVDLFSNPDYPLFDSYFILSRLYQFSTTLLRQQVEGLSVESRRKRILLPLIEPLEELPLRGKRETQC